MSEGFSSHDNHPLRTSPQPVTKAVKRIGQVLLALAILSAFLNLFHGAITFIGNWKGGWIQTATVSWSIFWILFPLVSGLVGLFLTIPLLIRSVSKTKAPVGRRWFVLSIATFIGGIIFSERIFGAAVIIFIYFIMNPLLPPNLQVPAFLYLSLFRKADSRARTPDPLKQSRFQNVSRLCRKRS